MTSSFPSAYCNTFTFMHLADAFIQRDLQCIQVMHVPWESNPQPFALLTQCSTTEPQEHYCSYLYWDYVQCLVHMVQS